MVTKILKAILKPTLRQLNKHVAQPFVDMGLGHKALYVGNADIVFNRNKERWANALNTGYLVHPYYYL